MFSPDFHCVGVENFLSALFSALSLCRSFGQQPRTGLNERERENVRSLVRQTVWFDFHTARTRSVRLSLSLSLSLFNTFSQYFLITCEWFKLIETNLTSISVLFCRGTESVHKRRNNWTRSEPNGWEFLTIFGKNCSCSKNCTKYIGHTVRPCSFSLYKALHFSGLSFMEA